MVELYGECLFLQPNGSDLYYAAEAIPLDPSITIPAISPNWKIFEIDPDYRFGFEIGAKALFTNPHLYLEANWERLHSHDSASKEVPLSTDMIGPLFDIGPNSAVYLNAKGKATFHFDAVNLVFGKQCCFFKNLYTNFFAGASFARIRQSLQSKYSNTSSSTSRIVETHSTFTGAGPVFGLDFDYRIAGRFFFTGSTSAGLIMGELENRTTYKSFAPFLAQNNIPEPNKQSTSVPDRSQLIPSFEEKLGFAYEALFKCWKFTIAAGYQAQIYLDAVQTIDMTAPQVLPSLNPGPTVNSGVYAVGFERTLSNFILTGPYATLAFDF